MHVTLSHEDVIEACKEWLARHYGIGPTSTPNVMATLQGNNTGVYTIQAVTVTFPEVPKPKGGPYRTPGER